MDDEKLKRYMPMPSELMSYLSTKNYNLTSYVRVWWRCNGEAIRRTFAYKTPKGKGQLVTEVMRETVTGLCITKNCYYNTYNGYVAVYSRTKPRSTWYSYCTFDEDDFEKWYTEAKPFGMSVVAELGKEIALSVYPRCGYQECCGDLMEYLKAYVKDPAVEYFGKLGIEPKPSYVKAAKNKQFVRFLIDNAEQVKARNAECVLYAFRHNKSFQESANILCKQRNALQYTLEIHELKGTGINRVKVYEYLRDNGVSTMNYDDYLKAIKGLGMDLTDTKNLFPNDFQRMHDDRIAEYASYKAKAKDEEMKKFDEKFNAKIQEYKELQEIGDNFQIIIPEHISDLVYEGEMLDHCVGRMGYDQKVIDGLSIIAFVRINEHPEVPFVTVEYKLDKHFVSQCYAIHDTKPSKEVLDYVAIWEQKVTKNLKERKKNEKNRLQLR